MVSLYFLSPILKALARLGKVGTKVEEGGLNENEKVGVYDTSCISSEAFEAQ
jgi:hypothetical protein